MLGVVTITNYHKRRTKLLGIHPGTAAARLRKKILFHLVKELNLDVCYRCKKKITKLNTFSTDHKKSWIYADDPVKAFFDLENIAFSHIKCNSGEGERPTRIYRDKKERIKGKNERYRVKYRKELLARRRKRYHETKKLIRDQMVIIA